MEILNDNAAEQSLLAACLASRHARDEARKAVTGAEFWQPAHEALWDAMARLDHSGKPVDPTTVLAIVRTNEAARLALIATMGDPGFPENVATYAAIVHGWAVKRALLAESDRLRQQALNPEVNALGLAAAAAARLASLRDTGDTTDAQSITLDELLTEPDDDPDWLIPGLLEKRDRLMLTGEEGLGKSYLLRQFAVMAAHGLDPFNPSKRVTPRRATIIDCENSQRQVKRKVRPVVEFARRYGSPSPHAVNLLCSPRIDIRRDRDLSHIHRELDATQPEVLVIGPLYRLTQGAIQTDDDAAPILAAIDSIRDAFDCAVLIEAHAGHALGKGGVRDLRPRGSSALLGWPEFGYGMRTVASNYVDMVPWRGDRDERDWPQRMRHSSDGIRWIPVDDPRFMGPLPDDWSSAVTA
jgi:replicative DNA helicase